GERQSRRYWSVGAQQSPYILGGFGAYQDPNTGVYVEEIRRFKQTNRQLSGVVAYPFNRSDRLEVSEGLQQISYDDELQKHGFNLDGSVAFDSTIHFPVPPPVTFEATGVALVHDNSFSAAPTPMLADRWRLDLPGLRSARGQQDAGREYRAALPAVRAAARWRRLLRRVAGRGSHLL